MTMVNNKTWQKIKNEILGKEYNLSIVLAGNNKMKELNRIYRKKDKIADVLSFPYSNKEGEIFLNINNSKNKNAFLYIHSLLHLKGIKHGRKMEQQENLYYNKIHET